ncbi:hypothetical protein GCM10027517_20440 [Phycicoccus ginsengisoli]
MDARVSALFGAQHGVAGWCQLNRLGVTADDVAGWVRAGEVVRLRRGAYAAAPVWAGADRDERYRLTVRGVILSRGSVETASRHSALALRRLPLWDVDRELVVLTADVAETATRSGLRVAPMRGLAAPDEVDGLPCEALPDSLVTTASFCVTAGVVAADAALHQRLCAREDIEEALLRLAPGLRGRRRARTMVKNLDPAAESPGESLTRLLLGALGLPVRSQVELRDSSGRFVGRVDFLVAGRVVVEFDGAVKYAGADGRDALVAEKRREDELRALGYAVVRLTWDDLRRPELVRVRVRAALSRAAA